MGVSDATTMHGGTGFAVGAGGRAAEMHDSASGCGGLGEHIFFVSLSGVTILVMPLIACGGALFIVR